MFGKKRGRPKKGQVAPTVAAAPPAVALQAEPPAPPEPEYTDLSKQPLLGGDEEMLTEAPLPEQVVQAPAQAQQVVQMTAPAPSAQPEPQPEVPLDPVWELAKPYLERTCASVGQSETKKIDHLLLQGLIHKQAETNMLLKESNKHAQENNRLAQENNRLLQELINIAKQD